MKSLRRPQPGVQGKHHAMGRSVWSASKLQLLGIERDKDQYELVNEALNLMFEKYGKPPIA